jgi:Zn-dependent peptidase ImmA (M78 family)
MREAGRKRFTVAHEIGHFILHRENQISCLPAEIARWENNGESPERQADSFASE